LLVAARLRVNQLERAESPMLQGATREITAILTEAIEHARSLTRELSPPIRLTGGLGAAVDWLADWMEAKHHLKVEAQTDDTAIPATEELAVLLFQALRELLFNIVKHTTVQTAQVEIARSDGQLRLSVSDAGGGFNPAELRVEGGPGGGFGLFSIRQRLELFGGRLDIDSAYGQGSRFTLWAPARPDPAGRPATPSVPLRSVSAKNASSPAAGVPAPAKIRVLVVDDHAVVREALAGMLGQEPDIQIVGEAWDGKLAVELVRQLRPDVVTMDINMPVMDGVKATRAIRAEFPAVRVIGLSMFDEAGQARVMREAGAAEYLSKSGPSEALIAAIRACVTRK
ncbi:MAG TPA: response regulator, partial [Candidatus Methylomirabilis sp.]|nr:response regulator [Candidatus Methylomirabilis sp.]